MNDNATPTPIATFFERVEEYGKSTMELLKLNAIDKSADVVSSLVSRLAVLMTLALSIIIINIGIALWIGKELGETYYGFLIIGFFYTMVTLLLHMFRNQWVKNPISNSIIKQMLKEKIV